jgi:hypothetical protein
MDIFVAGFWLSPIVFLSKINTVNYESSLHSESTMDISTSRKPSLQA